MNKIRRYANGVWSVYTEDLLRNWWEVDNLTTAEISIKFGQLGLHITRNAVISKIHRLKLTIRSPGKKEARLNDRIAENAKTIHRMKDVKPKIQITIKPPRFNSTKEGRASVSSGKPDGSRNILLKDSQDGMCKYIVGYVGGRCEYAVYCGEPTKAVAKGKHAPWCRFHHSICTQEARR
jgi:hypothetical protein